MPIRGESQWARFVASNIMVLYQISLSVACSMSPSENPMCLIRISADCFRIASECPANRNVWSATVSQAKNESDSLVCANVFGLYWSFGSGPGWNALRSRYEFLLNRIAPFHF